MNDEILLKDDAAKLLSCAPSTFEEWARTGSIPAAKVCGNWTTTKAALAEFIYHQAKSNLKAPKAPKPAAKAPKALLVPIPQKARRSLPTLVTLASPANS